jgi:hypothetical protein
VSVFGRSPSIHPVSDMFPPAMEPDCGGGPTRYARPCLPVKPLLMIEEVGMRSARHFWQRRCDVGRVTRKEIGCDGDEEGESIDVVEVLIAELRRRRKGRLGKR